MRRVLLASPAAAAAGRLIATTPLAAGYVRAAMTVAASAAAAGVGGAAAAEDARVPALRRMRRRPSAAAAPTPATPPPTPAAPPSPPPRPQPPLPTPAAAVAAFSQSTPAWLRAVDAAFAPDARRSLESRLMRDAIQLESGMGLVAGVQQSGDVSRAAAAVDRALIRLRGVAATIAASTASVLPGGAATQHAVWRDIYGTGLPPSPATAEMTVEALVRSCADAGPWVDALVAIRVAHMLAFGPAQAAAGDVAGPGSQPKALQSLAVFRSGPLPDVAAVFAPVIAAGRRLLPAYADAGSPAATAPAVATAAAGDPAGATPPAAASGGATAGDAGAVIARELLRLARFSAADADAVIAQLRFGARAIAAVALYHQGAAAVTPHRTASSRATTTTAAASPKRGPRSTAAAATGDAAAGVAAPIATAVGSSPPLSLPVPVAWRGLLRELRTVVVAQGERRRHDAAGPHFRDVLAARLAAAPASPFLRLQLAGASRTHGAVATAPAEAALASWFGDESALLAVLTRHAFDCDQLARVSAAMALADHGFTAVDLAAALGVPLRGAAAAGDAGAAAADAAPRTTPSATAVALLRVVLAARYQPVPWSTVAAARGVATLPASAPYAAFASAAPATAATSAAPARSASLPRDAAADGGDAAAAATAAATDQRLQWLRIGDARRTIVAHLRESAQQLSPSADGGDSAAKGRGAEIAAVARMQRLLDGLRAMASVPDRSQGSKPRSDSRDTAVAAYSPPPAASSSAPSLAAGSRGYPPASFVHTLAALGCAPHTAGEHGLLAALQRLAPFAHALQPASSRELRAALAHAAAIIRSTVAASAAATAAGAGSASSTRASRQARARRQELIARVVSLQLMTGSSAVDAPVVNASHMDRAAAALVRGEAAVLSSLPAPSDTYASAPALPTVAPAPHAKRAGMSASPAATEAAAAGAAGVTKAPAAPAATVAPTSTPPAPSAIAATPPPPRPSKTHLPPLLCLDGLDEGDRARYMRGASSLMAMMSVALGPKARFEFRQLVSALGELRARGEGVNPLQPPPAATGTPATTAAGRGSIGAYVDVASTHAGQALLSNVSALIPVRYRAAVYPLIHAFLGCLTTEEVDVRLFNLPRAAAAAGAAATPPAADGDVVPLAEETAAPVATRAQPLRSWTDVLKAVIDRTSPRGASIGSSVAAAPADDAAGAIAPSASTTTSQLTPAASRLAAMLPGPDEPSSPLAHRLSPASLHRFVDMLTRVLPHEDFGRLTKLLTSYTRTARAAAHVRAIAKRTLEAAALGSVPMPDEATDALSASDLATAIDGSGSGAAPAAAGIRIPDLMHLAKEKPVEALRRVDAVLEWRLHSVMRHASPMFGPLAVYLDDKLARALHHGQISAFQLERARRTLMSSDAELAAAEEVLLDHELAGDVQDGRTRELDLALAAVSAGLKDGDGMAARDKMAAIAAFAGADELDELVATHGGAVARGAHAAATGASGSNLPGRLWEATASTFAGVAGGGDTMPGAGGEAPDVLATVQGGFHALLLPMLLSRVRAHEAAQAAAAAGSSSSTSAAPSQPVVDASTQATVAATLRRDLEALMAFHRSAQASPTPPAPRASTSLDAPVPPMTLKGPWAGYTPVLPSAPAPSPTPAPAQPRQVAAPATSTPAASSAAAAAASVAAIPLHTTLRFLAPRTGRTSAGQSRDTGAIAAAADTRFVAHMPTAPSCAVASVQVAVPVELRGADSAAPQRTVQLVRLPACPALTTGQLPTPPGAQPPSSQRSSPAPGAAAGMAADDGSLRSGGEGATAPVHSLVGSAFIRDWATAAAPASIARRVCLLRVPVGFTAAHVCAAMERAIGGVTRVEMWEEVAATQYVRSSAVDWSDLAGAASSLPATAAAAAAGAGGSAGADSASGSGGAGDDAMDAWGAAPLPDFGTPYGGAVAVPAKRGRPPQLTTKHKRKLYQALEERRRQFHAPPQSAAFVHLESPALAALATSDFLRVFGMVLGQNACPVLPAAELVTVAVTGVPTSLTVAGAALALTGLLESAGFKAAPRDRLRPTVLSDGRVLLQASSHVEALQIAHIVRGVELVAGQPLQVAWVPAGEWRAARPRMPTYF